MKYIDGGWMLKEGFDAKFAEQVYDYRFEGDKLVLFCPFQAIENKGATLDGGLLTIEITAPRADVIGVKMYHYKGRQHKAPEFELNSEKVAATFEEQDDKYVYTSGKLSLEIFKDHFQFDYYFDGQYLTSSSARGKAYICDPAGDFHMSDQLGIDVGEKIYGLGERFTNFVKNGQSVDIWNADGGTGTQQAYKNIPFYISNRHYGVFVNTPDKASFEIGSEKVSRVQFSVPGEELEYFVMGGNNLKDVLGRYTDLTGKPSMPPAWTFGLWLSTSFLTNYDEKTVNEFVDGMIERDIPLEVFHFDCLWMKELEWCNFTWDERTFPDPINMLKRLKAKGIKICVWINSYIGQKSPLFDEGAEKGYFIKNQDGDVWQWDKWQAGMGIVDFTNPEATKWYQSKLKALLDMGVDCFKTDFGERIPTDGVYFDGSDPEKMHNYYTLLYNKAVYDVLAQERGAKEAVLFARSATVGSQKYPVHWGGDSSSNYPSMAESLRAGLSFGLSGFGYWSHDISGFEAEADPDLYKRWTQFGLLSSHSRYHGSWQYKTPWFYGEEAVAVSRQFTKLKLSLMPYLMAQNKKTHELGIPMMRAMVLEFPDDPACAELDRQYMLGDNLLVAPIFSKTGECTFYVPEAGGLWTNILSGEKYEGGQWYTQTFDYFNLPVLARPNSVLARGKEDSHAEYDYTDTPTLEAYEWNHDQEQVVEFTDTYGQQVGQVTLKQVSNEMTSQADNVTNYKIITK